MRFGDIFLWLLVAWCFLVFLVECTYKAPIKSVKRGHKGRVEYIKAEIKRQNLDTGSTTNPATRAYAHRMGSSNDDAGHLIAQRLGGTGRDTYNIVPQNKGINRGSWRARIERPIYDDVKKGNTVIFEVWPKYRTTRATRPYALEYIAKRPNGSIVVKKGTQPNPPSGGKHSGGGKRGVGKRGSGKKWLGPNLSYLLKTWL